MERTILHSDLNNYFASVECLLDPLLRDRPVAVCGNPAERHGIVLAKNQLAKQYGVSTGEAIWQARQKCPSLTVVPPHYRKYVEFSRQVRAIYCRYTDLVEPFGIDECWLDVGGSRLLFGTGEQIAEQIRRAVRQETGLTVSIGVSFNKTFAKLGSDLKKPDAITLVPQEHFRDIVWPLPVEDIIGVGRATAGVLARCGVHTIGQLASLPKRAIHGWLGAGGVALWERANGLDYAPVAPYWLHTPPKSIGRGVTCICDLHTDAEVRQVIIELAQEVARGLRAEKLSAGGIRLTVKDNRLVSADYSGRPPAPTRSWTLLWRQAFDIFTARYSWQTPVRALTVTAFDLIADSSPRQLSLFDDRLSDPDRLSHLEDAVEDIRLRFGDGSIFPACTLLDHALPGHARFRIRAGTPEPIAKHL